MLSTHSKPGPEDRAERGLVGLVILLAFSRRDPPLDWGLPVRNRGERH